MTTINLYQNQAEKESQMSVRGVNKGFFFSLGILGLTLLVLLGLKIYVPIAQKESAALETSIASENAKLVGLKDLEQVVDTQKRTEEIKKNLKIVDGKVSRTEMSKVIDMVAAEMNNNVVVSSLDYDAGKVSINFIANSFNDASKQIFNLKKSTTNFSDVSLTSLSRQEGGVNFAMDMKLK